MTESEAKGTAYSAKLPPLSPSLSRQSDGYKPSLAERHGQQRSPPMQQASSVGSAAFPPPPPTRIHSYHHPIAASYASSSNHHDRNRPPPPSLWSGPRSPPLEHRSSEGSGSSFSRVLPPLSNSGSSIGSSNSSAFQLPSLSASLPSSASWHGREGQRTPATNGTHLSSFRANREALANDARRHGQDPMLPSLSGQFGDLNGSRRPPVEASSAALTSPTVEDPSQAGRKPAKAHVPSACLNCKRAHLACDVGRPCRRCVNLGKSDTCIDVQHKKRGRPRLKDRPASQSGVATLQGLDGKSDVSGSPASASYTRQSPGSEAGYFRSSARTTDLMSPPLISSSTVMHVSGRTHGPSTHPRSASSSVSASSYPYSRPDHLRHPMDVDSHGGAYASASWSYQQNGSHGHDGAGKSSLMHSTSARHHSHSLSYAQSPYQQSQQQQSQSQPQHQSGHHSSQPLSNPHTAVTTSDNADSAVSAVVTMICSTNLQCARISDECTALLGYQPSELKERSLFELVHPSETSRLQDIWTSLIDPVGVVPQAVPAAAEVVMGTPAARLMTPAAGTIFVQENMRLRQRNGMYDFYSVRLHLGGGFGVDLYRRETLDRAYIVASLLKLGNDAVHPDPALLRSPYSHDPAQTRGAFRTPSGLGASAGPKRTERWEADEASQRSRSNSVHTRPAPLESNMRRSDAPSQPHVTNSNGRETQTHGQADLPVRGVKRSSAEMDEDEPITAPASAPAASRHVAMPASVGGAAKSAYNSAKAASAGGGGAVRSPPSVKRSVLSEGTRDTSRDGILC